MMKRKSFRRFRTEGQELAVIGLVAALLLVLLVITGRTAPRRSASPAPPPAAAPAAPAVAPELPPSPASHQIPTLGEGGEQQVDRRIRALAEEMGRMWTRDPEKLVSVIDAASRSATASPPVTLLLAIAQAETNGKILEVSEAAAVGLAQATPVAYLQEELSGPLFLTSAYFVGARAYLTKKPLGDADTISSLLLKKDDEKTRKRAKRLLDEAIRLRREGYEELEILRPYAPAVFYRRVEEADAHNLKRLLELRRLIDHGTPPDLKEYRDRVRKEYRDLKALQTTSWKEYQKEIVARRDSMLEQHFGIDAATVNLTMAYEASEYLGQHLDERFSATTMAKFLVKHLDRKASEARALAQDGDTIEEMTAALYNGGSHNVKRMLAGLIKSLPETDRYKRRVPATRRRLDARLAAAEDAREPEARPGEETGIGR